MRNMPYDTFLKDEKDKKQISRIYGGMQVSATIMTMGNIHSAFTPAFPIQLAAFLMTLVKKNILSAREWHIIYMLSLFINVHSLMTLEITTILFMGVLINVFEILRFDYKINKYTLWHIICYLYREFYYGKFDNMVNVVNEYSESVGVDNIKYVMVGLFYLKNIGENRIDSKHNLITTLAINPNGKPVYAIEGSVFMGGAIVMIVLLVVVLPVTILISGALLAGILGGLLKKDVDTVYEGSELLDLGD